MKMKPKRTQKQIDAARRNGAKSTGPKTAEGKARSSRNAVTHGLTSAVILLESEDANAYNQLVASYIDAWQPADQRELDLVHRLVADTWRLNRILTAEAYTLHTHIEDNREKIDREWQGAADPEHHIGSAVEAKLQQLDRYSRFESRIRRASNATVAQLRALQADRRKREAAEDAAENAPEAPAIENVQNEPGDAQPASFPKLTIVATPPKAETVRDAEAPPAA